MTEQTPTLFSPFTLGAVDLPNRIVMAPLTRSRADENGVLSPMTATYYRQRATAGLIISEATSISPTAMGYAWTPGIWSVEQVAAWRGITDAVHAEGGRIFLQLWHTGRISHPDVLPEGEEPVAPSAIRPEGQAFTYEGLKPHPTPRALRTDELPGLVQAYKQAAENAKAAGFDGVEVHAANGYLLDQFLRDGTNKREDAYGGSPENRARLVLEVVDAVTQVWEPDRVGVRLSPNGTFNDISDSDPQDTFGYVADQLGQRGLAYLHLIQDTPAEGLEPHQIADIDAVARRFAGPVILNGGYTRATGERAVESGRADLIAYGQLFIANPDLVTRFHLDAPLNAPDPSTFYGGDHRGYTDYPTLEQRPAETVSV